jgi:hypothetical protein
VSEDGINEELQGIEPNYRIVREAGGRASPSLRRMYESELDSEYKARAVYALSLVSREMDDVLVSAARSRSPAERRAAAGAAGRLMPQRTAAKVLDELLRDPDPSVRFVAERRRERRDR